MLNRDDLEPGDFILGWEDSDAMRYCHTFNLMEINDLILAVKDEASVFETYDADGRSGIMNSYVILRRS